MMHCADGSVIDIRETDDPSYTFSNIAMDRWEIVEEDTDSLEKLGEDYGLLPEGVRHAIEAYQDIICEITGDKLSKLTYDADFVIEQAEEYYKQKYGKQDDD
jgi:hypothetical protein